MSFHVGSREDACVPLVADSVVVVLHDGSDQSCSLSVAVAALDVVEDHHFRAPLVFLDRYQNDVPCAVESFHLWEVWAYRVP